MVLDAILETGLPDRAAKSGVISKTPFDTRNREHYGCFLDLWHKHLMRTVLSPSRPATRIGSVLREGARRYCEMAGLSEDGDHKAVVKAMCEWGVLSSTNAVLFFDPPLPGYPSEANIQASAGAAAARLDNAAVARRVAASLEYNGWWPREAILEDVPEGFWERVFEYPPTIAAFYGSRDVLRAFKGVLPGSRFLKDQVLRGCSRRGDPENLRALWDEQELGHGIQGGDNMTEAGAIGHMYHSGDPGMVELYRELAYKTKGLPPPPPLPKGMGFAQSMMLFEGSDMSHSRLDLYAAERGHVRMLEFVHEHCGYDGHSNQCTPVSVAARRFQKTTVEWILGRVASTVEWMLGRVVRTSEETQVLAAFETQALAGAARGGSLETARFLVEQGVVVRGGSPEPLIYAVLAEHTGIIELLRDQGALTEDAKKKALGAARNSGLESMVELLESYDC